MICFYKRNRCVDYTRPGLYTDRFYKIKEGKPYKKEYILCFWIFNYTLEIEWWWKV